MRLPKALEFPAVILVTGVLTFTGVSALQAAVNPPLYERVQKALDEAEAEAAYYDGDDFDYSTAADDLRELLSQEDVVPTALQPASESVALDAAQVDAPALAVTGQGQEDEGSGEVAGDAPGTPDQAVQAAYPVANTPEPGVHVPAAAGIAVQASAHAATPAPAAQQHAAAPAKAAPTPVSGMDYVWDQVFGGGNYAKPGTQAKKTTQQAAKSQGAGNAAVCPPGQAKKANC